MGRVVCMGPCCLKFPPLNVANVLWMCYIDRARTLNQPQTIEHAKAQAIQDKQWQLLEETRKNQSTADIMIAVNGNMVQRAVDVDFQKSDKIVMDCQPCALPQPHTAENFLLCNVISARYKLNNNVIANVIAVK
jgi:hypothetical protein